MKNGNINNIVLGKEIGRNIYESIKFNLVNWSGRLIKQISFRSALTIDKRELEISDRGDKNSVCMPLLGCIIVKALVTKHNTKFADEECEDICLIWDKCINPFLENEEYRFRLCSSSEIQLIIKELIENEQFKLFQDISVRLPYSWGLGSSVSWTHVFKKVHDKTINAWIIEVLFSHWLEEVLIELYCCKHYQDNLMIVTWVHNKLTDFARKNKRNAKHVSARLWDVLRIFHKIGFDNEWALIDYFYAALFNTSCVKRGRLYLNVDELSNSLLMILFSQNIKFQLVTFKQKQKRNWIHLQVEKRNGQAVINCKTNSKELTERQHITIALKNFPNLTESELNSCVNDKLCRMIVERRIEHTGLNSSH